MMELKKYYKFYINGLELFMRPIEVLDIDKASTTYFGLFLQKDPSIKREIVYGFGRMVVNDNNANYEEITKQEFVHVLEDMKNQLREYCSDI